MLIHQGDIYWYDFGLPRGSEPGYRRPVVVLQNNVLNAGTIATTIICATTGNLRHGREPGNVVLSAREAGLPYQTVVNVSQLYTVDNAELQEYVGTLSPTRIREVLAGLHLLTEPREPPTPKDY